VSDDPHSGLAVLWGDRTAFGRPAQDSDDPDYAFVPISGTLSFASGLAAISTLACLKRRR